MNREAVDFDIKHRIYLVSHPLMISFVEEGQARRKDWIFGKMYASLAENQQSYKYSLSRFYTSLFFSSPHSNQV